MSRLAAAFLTLLLVGLLAPTLSHAAWTAPVNVSNANQDAATPQVAVDADGDAVFTWKRFDGTNWRIQARARSAAGVLSAVQTLSDTGQDAHSPQVAVDDAGNAVFTWSRSDGTNARIQTRTRAATTGKLSAVQDLSESGNNAFAPQLDVDADGDAVFAWSLDVGASPQLAQTRARSAAGILSAVQTLADSGSDALPAYPKVGVDADGDAVFTWERAAGTSLKIQTRARDHATGHLGTVKNLGLSAMLDVHRIAVADSGDAAFTWVSRDGSTLCGGIGCLRIQAQVRSAAGAVSAVQNLTPGGRDAFDPEVGVDDAGNAVFTWSRSDGLNSLIQTRARATTGTLSAVQNLSDAGQNAFAPQVAVDADGDAVFTWSRYDGTIPDPDFPCCARIQARTRSTAGTLGGVQDLSAAGQDAFNSQVGVDVTGDAVATWQRSDGINDRIQASAGP
jgi:hypothetical protein